MHHSWSHNARVIYVAYVYIGHDRPMHVCACLYECLCIGHDRPMHVCTCLYVCLCLNVVCCLCMYIYPAMFAYVSVMIAKCSVMYYYVAYNTHRSWSPDACIIFMLVYLWLFISPDRKIQCYIHVVYNVYQSWSMYVYVSHKIVMYCLCLVVYASVMVTQCTCYLCSIYVHRSWSPNACMCVFVWMSTHRSWSPNARVYVFVCMSMFECCVLFVYVYLYISWYHTMQVCVILYALYDCCVWKDRQTNTHAQQRTVHTHRERIAEATILNHMRVVRDGA